MFFLPSKQRWPLFCPLSLRISLLLINLLVPVFWWYYILVSLGWICSSSELLGHGVSLCLALLVTASFPIWLCQFPFLPAMYGSSSCFTSSPILGIVSLLNFSNFSFRFLWMTNMLISFLDILFLSAYSSLLSFFCWSAIFF